MAKDVSDLKQHIQTPKFKTSPCGRFQKSNNEIGRGRFKNVWKALDKKTDSDVAWCEMLLVSQIGFFIIIINFL